MCCGSMRKGPSAWELQKSNLGQDGTKSTGGQCQGQVWDATRPIRDEAVQIPDLE